jgi:hypothetical protein
MNAQKRNDQSKRDRSSMAYGRGHSAGGAQFTNGYRTAGGPDYRSVDWQTSEHPRGKRNIG